VEVRANARENRIEVLLQDDVEEARYAYDLVQSGRLLTERRE
jgi:hypothetical protein